MKPGLPYLVQFKATRALSALEAGQDKDALHESVRAGQYARVLQSLGGGEAVESLVSLLQLATDALRIGDDAAADYLDLALAESRLKVGT